MKQFQFEIYWSQNEITYFTIKSLSESDARRSLNEFLGQDVFKVSITLME